MEPTDDVLVVIQAESGEEIALPLTALDEQHQEVIVDGDTSRDVTRAQFDSDIVVQTVIESAQSEPETIQKPAPVKAVRKPKQKRKEKLILLPFTEDDMKLDFQTVEEPSPQPNDDGKRRPRREYRTRKKLAALEAGNNDNKPVAKQTAETDEDECQKVKTEEIEQIVQIQEKEEQIQKQDFENRSNEQTSIRRTRLSNSFRIATSKLYKCPECDFTTERINNIVMHSKDHMKGPAGK